MAKPASPAPQRIGNAEIVAIFDEIADLLEIAGANPFRIRAYRNAARVIGGLGLEIAAMIARGDEPADLPGIGTDLAAKIREILATETTPLLARLRKETPPALVALLRLPGLGPKRARKLVDTLKIRSLDDLRRAAARDQLAAVLGPKTAAGVAAALAGPPSGRFARAVVAPVARAIIRQLAPARGVDAVVVAGSFRRARPDVGDLDVLISAAKGSDALDRFVALPNVDHVLVHGPTRAAIVLRSGLQVDARLIAPESFGAALVYFTGSKAHNIALRKRALARGLKLNEYGVFRGTRRIAGATEESVYGTLDLPVIPPALRENSGEIEAAEAGTLAEFARSRRTAPKPRAGRRSG